NIYTGASLALDGQFATMHEVDVQLQREKKFVPSTDALVPFVRPSFYALLLAPLGLIPYATAFWVWIGAQSALLIGCWAWGFRRFGPNALVFAAFSLPAPLGVASGQDCVILLVLFILAFELTDRERPAAGGAALALMLIKFHLILLWPVALLLQRRWKMLAGFCAMAAGEAFVSLALGGMKGARTYAALLQNKSLDHLSPSKELMISFQGLTENLGITSPPAIAAVIGVIFLIFLFAVYKAPLWKMFAVTAVASLLVAPHVYGYDATLLLLPFLLTIFNSQLTGAKIVATLLCTPLPFGFALAGKPYAVVASASLVIFLLLLAIDRERSPSSPRSAPASSPSG
ncbi:MAG: glycosyltransferase family 87 protein, partial [Bryobacteraceae bacterium]